MEPVISRPTFRMLESPNVDTFFVKKAGAPYLIRAEGSQVIPKLENIAHEIAILIKSSDDLLFKPTVYFPSYDYDGRDALRAVVLAAKEHGPTSLGYKSKRNYQGGIGLSEIDEVMSKIVEKIIGLTGELTIFKLYPTEGDVVTIDHEAQIKLVLEERIDGSWFPYYNNRKFKESADRQGSIEIAQIQDGNIVFSPKESLGQLRTEKADLEVKMQELEPLMQSQMIHLLERLDAASVMSDIDAEAILAGERYGAWLVRRNEEGELVISSNSSGDNTDFTHVRFSDIPSTVYFDTTYNPQLKVI